MRLLTSAAILVSSVVAESSDSPTWLKWALDGGATLNPALTIDRNGRISSTKPVASGETLFTVPKNIILEGVGEDVCQTARFWAKELKNSKSPFRPYLQSISVINRDLLPTQWSDEGIDLITFILDDARHQVFPPNNVFGMTYRQECNVQRTNDGLEHAYLLAIQRGTLIPLHDDLPHSRRPNTLFDVSDDGTVTVSAARDLKVGEDLTASYQIEDCIECGGTPELLRDYGFLEDYPQRYVLRHRRGLAFDIDKVDNDRYEITWLYDQPPPESSIDFLVEQLFRLEALAVSEFKENWVDPDSDEYQLAWGLLQSMITALTHVIDWYWTLDLKNCEDGESSCLVVTGDLNSRYDDLEEKEDKLDYAEHVCEQGRHMEFPNHIELQDARSLYQRIIFFRDTRTDDMCFELETTVQMCSSYRPHYHKTVVHWTARHLKNVRRVVFVGGGDSMLLHEILLYPQLELVVGLELDQQVTRLSYKYFGTQPHWDKHEKVQWWYGDAAKSLLMLPKEYFGSFDMVLVDLSETVMSMTVTEGLDIFGALALLLQPEGIIVKNELYLENFSKIFDYTVQANIHLVPIICSQHLIFGSYENDMLHKDLTDHNLSGILYTKPLDDGYYRYDLWHDYRRLEAEKSQKNKDSHCRRPGELDAEPEIQKASPGILMILEAEGNAKVLDKQKMEGFLKASGCFVIKTVESSNGATTMLVTMMEEGYVAARCWPNDKYCAFDIHLWGKYNKHDVIKQSMLELVGSTSSSSYRIVAGGVFGLDDWQADEMSRGPTRTRICQDEEDPNLDPGHDTSSMNSVIQQAFDLLLEPKPRVVYVCGPVSVNCNSLDTIDTTKLDHVLTLKSCAGIDKENEYAFSAMLECEKKIRSSIESVSEGGPIHSFVIDSGVPFEFGQVLHRVLSSRLFREEFVHENVTILAVSAPDTWRGAFVDRYRTQNALYDPSFRAKALFHDQSSQQTMELNTLVVGDGYFFENFVNFCNKVESKLGMKSDIRNIQGSLETYKPDIQFTHFFSESDHNSDASLEQWQTQTPLARQHVYQLETDKIHLTERQFDEAVVFVTSQLEDELSEDEQHAIVAIGDGGVHAIFWSGGTIIVLWDGRRHVDINVFTIGKEDWLAGEFAENLKSAVPGLGLRLRDDQPRGYGKVVNFWEDIESAPETPKWVK